MVVGMSTRVTTALILAIALGLALTFAIPAVARNKQRKLRRGCFFSIFASLMILRDGAPKKREA